MCNKYKELDTLISEYEADSKMIRDDKMIMKNYPKVLVMSMASLFEKELKNTCQNFLDKPTKPLSSNYAKIDSLKHKSSNKPLTDKMFAKLEGYYDKNGKEVLSAQKFYDLFGGNVFRNEVELKFNNVLIHKKQQVSFSLTNLKNLCGREERFEDEWGRQSDIMDQLKTCSFNKAEEAYLSLKLRRNRVAHDYINGLSDSCKDIEQFYYDAILYIISLEAAIEDKTVHI